jgi:hypothetical protein
LFVALVALAGCGGDDEGAGEGKRVGAAAVLTKEEIAARRAFIRKADAICTTYLERKPETEPTTQQEVEALVDLLVEVQADQLRELHALSLPTGSQGLARDWLTARDRVADYTRVFGDAFLKRDQQAMSVAGQQVGAAVEKSDGLARTIGLQVCRDSELIDLRASVVPREQPATSGQETTPPSGAGKRYQPVGPEPGTTTTGG